MLELKFLNSMYMVKIAQISAAYIYPDLHFALPQVLPGHGYSLKHHLEQCPYHALVLNTQPGDKFNARGNDEFRMMQS